jgi:cytochrome c-type biogenesis protein CcmH/NrfG
MMVSNRLAIAVIAAAVMASTSTSWAREQRPQHKQEHNLRAPKPKDAPFGTQSLKEPFTAAEKRAFQEPTGREVDRW